MTTPEQTGPDARPDAPGIDAPGAGTATAVAPTPSAVLPASSAPADPRALRRAVAAIAGDRRRALLGLHGRELAAGRSWSSAVDELVTARYAALVGSRVTTAA